MLTTHNPASTDPSRRRLLQAIALAAAQSTLACSQSEPHKYSIEVLRGASRIHGTGLTNERLEAIQTKVEDSLAEIKAIRRFDLDERVEPATLFLAKL